MNAGTDGVTPVEHGPREAPTWVLVVLAAAAFALLVALLTCLIGFLDRLL